MASPQKIEQKPKFLSLALKSIGVLLLLVGIVGAYYGPLEIHVFSFFSEGGQFHYPGFGFGSLWFAYLVVQNIGYYIIAALLIPIGIGHLNLRRWALTLTQLYIWLWLGSGILLIVNFIGLIPSLYRLDLNQSNLILRSGIIGIFALIFFLLLPVLLLKFYRSDKVRNVFENHDSNIYWTEKYPFTLLALNLIFVIIIFVLHIAIFLQSIFPIFGRIMFGRPSIYILSACILIIGFLIYGVSKLKSWSWWGSLVYLSLLTVSSVVSFSRHSFYDILIMMKLPAYEMEYLNKLVLLHNYHLTSLMAFPLLIALGLLIYSKRYFPGKTTRISHSTKPDGTISHFL